MILAAFVAAKFVDIFCFMNHFSVTEIFEVTIVPLYLATFGHMYI